MTPDYALAHVLPAALGLLPARMSRLEADAMLIAIALQESKFQHRRQVQGPARGYWQFEPIGVKEVLTHRATSGYALSVCTWLDYSPNVSVVHPAMADNDVLAAAFARLALWRLPDGLPARSETSQAWHQYLRVWAPGKPHPETWAGCWARAWETVETEK